jgi:hypothetical protein
MWWGSKISLAIALVATIIFSSCGNSSKEGVYPFSQAERIEVISYSSRTMWDDDDRDFIIEGRLNLNDDKFKERVELNEEQKESLYQFLFEEECPVFSSVSKCYEPRHLILFYDKEGKLFNYFEVCLECSRAEAGFEHNDVCDERMADF